MRATQNPGAVAPARPLVGLVLLGVAAGMIGPSWTVAAERSDYRVRPKAAAVAAGRGDVYEADNPASGLRVELSPDGILVSDRSNGPAAWWVGLALTRIEVDGRDLVLAPARLAAADGRVDVDLGAVTGWYLNGEAGVEQGFTVGAPATSAAAGLPQTLAVYLSLDGSLTPRSTPPSYFVDLAGPDGASLFRLGALRAVDASGRVLSARLELTGAPAGGRDVVRIVVDADGAEFPVQVSATLRSARLPGPPAGAPGGEGSSEVVGNPVVLEAGVTESVAEIMERERFAPPPLLRKPRETYHEYEAELERRRTGRRPRSRRRRPCWPRRRSRRRSARASGR
jgi:hypothetical protein